jgi:hypothetical protein
MKIRRGCSSLTGLDWVAKKNEVAKPCLISCSVLKDEIEQLIRQGDLDAKVVFVSKYFHVDYSLVEKYLRPTPSIVPLVEYDLRATNEEGLKSEDKCLYLQVTSLSFLSRTT